LARVASISRLPCAASSCSACQRAASASRFPYHVHGFRSSFRDWAAEKMPRIPDPVAESAIAHIVPDKVVRAYKRTKFIEMRRQLLDGWGKLVTAKVPSTSPE